MVYISAISNFRCKIYIKLYSDRNFYHNINIKVKKYLLGHEPMDRREKARQLRAKILTYIEQHPGVHFSGIRRALSISSGRLTYNVAKLEESGEIFSEVGQYWKHFFHASMKRRRPQVLPPREKEIMEYIAENPGAVYKDFVKDLGRTRQAHMYNIKKLIEKGFLRMKIVWKEHHFYTTAKKYL